MTFSKREGLEPEFKLVQNSSMDLDLRNSLWNGLFVFLFNKIERKVGHLFRPFFATMWIELFKAQIDEMPAYSEIALAEFKAFFFGCKWNKVYDAVEFVLANCDVLLSADDKAAMVKFINRSLESEMSAWRVVDNRFVRVTDDRELSTIAAALESAKAHSLRGVYDHLALAADKLSDREAPDYRNSIKESISAVEAVARLIANDGKATLGDALKKLERQNGLHPSLKAGFSALWLYE